MTHVLWFATRGTGVVALILLTGVVSLGIGGSLRLRSERWPRFLVVGLHRNLTLLALVFLAGHIGTTLLDSYTPVRLQDAFIPLVAQYRPLWLGLGAVALDLLLALTVTSLLRARIGYRPWRALHWLAYAAWPVALAHALGTGSDARFLWMQVVGVVCVVAVLAALGARLAGSAAAPGARALAGAAALAVVLAGGLWYGTGPAAHGWAKRAGTPAALLGRPARPVAAAATTVAQQLSDLPAAPFSTQLTGRLTTTMLGGGLVRVDIRGRTRGAVDGLLWIRLQGQAIQDGGVSMTASGARFGPRSDPNLYVGAIRALSGTQMAIRLRDAAGRRIDLDVNVNVDQTTSTVTGSVRAVAAAGDSE